MAVGGSGGGGSEMMRRRRRGRVYIEFGRGDRQGRGGRVQVRGGRGKRRPRDGFQEGKIGCVAVASKDCNFCKISLKMLAPVKYH